MNIGSPADVHRFFDLKSLCENLRETKNNSTDMTHKLHIAHYTMRLYLLALLALPLAATALPAIMAAAVAPALACGAATPLRPDPAVPA